MGPGSFIFFLLLYRILLSSPNRLFPFSAILFRRAQYRSRNRRVGATRWGWALPPRHWGWSPCWYWVAEANRCHCYAHWIFRHCLLHLGYLGNLCLHSTWLWPSRRYRCWSGACFNQVWAYYTRISYPVKDCRGISLRVWKYQQPLAPLFCTLLLYLFMGCSYSIGMATTLLKEHKFFDTMLGRTVAAAAVVDDVLPLVLLAVLGALADMNNGTNSGESTEMQVWYMVRPVLSSIFLVVFGVIVSLYMPTLYTWFMEVCRWERHIILDAYSVHIALKLVCTNRGYTDRVDKQTTQTE